MVTTHKMAGVNFVVVRGCCSKVFRHDADDLSHFTLVGQTVFRVAEESLGELLVDVSGQPLSVKAGDVLGFHVVDQPVIPYDVDETRMTTLYCQSLDRVEGQTDGHTIAMESNLDVARIYSLRANITASCEFFSSSWRVKCEFGEGI